MTVSAAGRRAGAAGGASAGAGADHHGPAGSLHDLVHAAGGRPPYDHHEGGRGVDGTGPTAVTPDLLRRPRATGARRREVPVQFGQTVWSATSNDMAMTIRLDTSNPAAGAPVRAPDGQPPTHRYAQAGVYTVTVTTWSTGCDGGDEQKVSGASRCNSPSGESTCA